MKTFAKTLAGIIATASLATAEEKAAKPDATDAAGQAAKIKLEGNRAGEEREFEIAPGVKMTFCCCPAGEFVMGSPTSEEGRDSGDEEQAKVTLKAPIASRPWKSFIKACHKIAVPRKPSPANMVSSSERYHLPFLSSKGSLHSFFDLEQIYLFEAGI